MKKILNVKPFECDILIVYADGLEEAVEEIELELAITDGIPDDNTRAMVYFREDEPFETNEGQVRFILLLDSNSITLSIVAHEVLHLVNRIMHFHGCRSSYLNDEVDAYLLGYLFKEIVSLIYGDEGKIAL